MSPPFFVKGEKMSKYIKRLGLALLLICLLCQPQKASAFVFTDVNIDIQYCECPDELVDIVGNKTYVYFAKYEGGAYREWLAVYDYSPSTLQVWWNNSAHTTLRVSALDGSGSTCKPKAEYYRNNGGEWTKSSYAYGYTTFEFQACPTAVLKYNNIETLKVLTKVYTSETVRPTPSPSPTPTAVPVVNIDIEETGITKLFSGVMRIFNIPMQINKIEFTWWHIFIYLILAGLVLDLVFAPSDK